MQTPLEHFDLIVLITWKSCGYCMGIVICLFSSLGIIRQKGSFLPVDEVVTDPIHTILKIHRENMGRFRWWLVCSCYPSDCYNVIRCTVVAKMIRTLVFPSAISLAGENTSVLIILATTVTLVMWSRLYLTRQRPHLYTLSCDRRAGLDLPDSVSVCVQVQTLGDLAGQRRRTQILLIRKDEDGNACEVFLIYQLWQLLQHACNTSIHI